MGDELLADTDIEEALSEAYLWALASHAGYVLAKKNFDRDGVDITVEAGSDFRPKIDLQLKASINLPEAANGVIKYPCPRKNYDKLIIPTQTPRILGVLKLPRNKEDWISVRSNALVLRETMYWVSLKGAPASDNKQSITVDIPATNRLTIDTLVELMEKSRTGVL